MKKQLLLSGVLLFSLGSFAQNQKARPSGFVKMSERHFAYGLPIEKQDAQRVALPANNPQPIENSQTSESASSPILSANFQVISGSMNVFGMLINNQKPLQYSRYVDAVTFIQRKSQSYTPTPPSNGNSGTMVAMIGKNYGTVWDSTCIWADATNAGRYPQGAIYNPPGNTDIANAYVVGTGPVVSGSWIGSWYASKLIGPAGTTSPGADQQFFPNAGSFSTTTSPTMTKHDFPAFGFASTDDGAVRTLASVVNDPNGTSNLAYGPRGAFIGKGTFNAGVFVWTPDTLIPPVVTRTDGSRQLWGGRMMMAWNDQGTIGYVVMIGGRQGATGSNVAWQPLVYKTTNSGNTWALTNPINFNGPGFDKVLDGLQTISTSTIIAAPWFDMSEGGDCTVDKDGKLHIVCPVKSGYSNHQDSLDYTYTFYSGNSYSWFFVNHGWPYVFDFYGDGSSNWALHTVDSLGTEGPSDQSGGPGFNFNPWANQAQANPVSSGMRFQMSRSIGGEYIFYTWAESDTLLTTSSKKWNEYPNIKMRALRVCDGAISTNELTVTSPSVGFNPKVRDKAFFHFVSPTCKAGSATASAVTATVPITVTNNDITDGGAPVRTYYANVTVQFNFSSNPSCLSTVGLTKVSDVNEVKLFPNPAINSVNIEVTLNNSANYEIQMVNALGQLLHSESKSGFAGSNSAVIALNNINSGIYFVKIKTTQGETVKKLIVE